MSAQPPESSGKWKRIGSHSKQTGGEKRDAGGQPKQPAAENSSAEHLRAGGHAVPKKPVERKGRFVRYLKFQGDAYCHSHEGLFMLMPEAEPSLGYKLQEITGNTKTITEGGEEITEDRAIHIIFKS